VFEARGAFTNNNNNNVFETRMSKHIQSDIQLVSFDTTRLLHHQAAAAVVVDVDNTTGSTGRIGAEHIQVDCKHPATEHYKLLPCT
ncbi:hypothetical protein Tco_0943891, partial [Tanacetum coccineum]